MLVARAHLRPPSSGLSPQGTHLAAPVKPVESLRHRLGRLRWSAFVTRQDLAAHYFPLGESRDVWRTLEGWREGGPQLQAQPCLAVGNSGSLGERRSDGPRLLLATEAEWSAPCASPYSLLALLEPRRRSSSLAGCRSNRLALESNWPE